MNRIKHSAQYRMVLNKYMCKNSKPQNFQNISINNRNFYPYFKDAILTYIQTYQYLLVLFSNSKMGNVTQMYAEYQAKKKKEQAMENAEGFNPFGDKDGSEIEVEDNLFDKRDSDQRKQKEEKGGFFGFFNSKDKKSGQQQYEQQQRKQKKSFFGSRQAKNKDTTSSYASPTSQHNRTTHQASQTIRQQAGQYSDYGNGKQIYFIKEFQVTYQGAFSNNIPHGQGVAHFKDGSYYAGNFREGEADGKGIYVFRDGSYYKGDFKDSKFHGLGKMHYSKTNVTYDGEWSEGVPAGRGFEKSYEGEYEGQFKDGKKNGYGVYKWQDERRYEGQFSEGCMEGKGLLYEDGIVTYAGNFIKGKKQGDGTMKTKNGSYSGGFKDDMWEGKGTYCWNDGKAYEGEFRKNKMQGDGQMYFPSGQIVKGEWSQGHSTKMSSTRNDKSDASDKIQKIQKSHNLKDKQEQFKRQSKRYSKKSESFILRDSQGKPQYYKRDSYESGGYQQNKHDSGRYQPHHETGGDSNLRYSGGQNSYKQEQYN